MAVLVPQIAEDIVEQVVDVPVPHIEAAAHAMAEEETRIEAERIAELDRLRREVVRERQARVDEERRRVLSVRQRRMPLHKRGSKRRPELRPLLKQRPKRRPESRWRGLPS